MEKSVNRIAKLRLAAFALGAVALPVHATAAPASLSLAQVTNTEQVMALPVCSKSVTTNCRKAGSNGTWIVIGLVAVGAVVGLAASGGSKTPPPPISP